MKQVSINCTAAATYHHSTYPSTHADGLSNGLRRLIAAVALLLISLAPGSWAADEVPADLGFKVWMDDKPLGTHNYTFSQDETGELLRVDSKAVFNVKVLFVNVFSYDHSAREHWNGHCLSALNSETTTNDEKEAIDLRFDDDSCAGTYAYWDSSRLRRNTLTNAQTGEQEDASWEQLAPTALPRPSRKAKISNPPNNVDHYQLKTPSASFLLWYDDQGRSLAMQTTNDGRTITYINSELL